LILMAPSSLCELAARVHLYGRRRLVMDASSGPREMLTRVVRPFLRSPVFTTSGAIAEEDRCKQRWTVNK
jgi:hypothetical protein